MQRSENKLIVLVQAMRMYQWTKNLLVLAPLVFAQYLTDIEKVGYALLAFLAFCCASSATYLFNDLMDIEQDRSHPKKCHRPLASGALGVSTAWTILIVLLGGALGVGYLLGTQFFFSLIFYLALTVSYSLWLKHLLVIDVLAVAMGFVVRAMAGAVAIDVVFSNWLVVCTFFLATFLALSKRRSEMTLLEKDAHSHRGVLFHYSITYLDQLILMMAVAAILTYTIYTCSPEVVDRLGTDKLYLTLPFVVYGLFRYLFLVQHRTGGGDPSRMLLKDWPLGLTVFLWALTCAVIIYTR